MEEKKEKEIPAEFLCPICMQLFYQPAYTPCKHLFCLECITQVLELEQRCPLCRTDIPSEFVPKVDAVYNANLIKKFQLQMKTREEEIKKREHELLKVKFLYGNTHKLVNPEDGEQNSHDWTAFVKAGRNETNTAKYIKSVTFKLHPTFVNPERRITAPPFEVRCVGWGYFQIPITIRWKPELGVPDTHLSHVLSFDENGKTVPFFIEFNKKKLAVGEEAESKKK